MVELKPCPFCLGEAKLMHGKPWQQSRQRRIAFVQCRACKAKTQTFEQLAYQAWQEVDNLAIEAWNRRANNE